MKLFAALILIATLFIYIIYSFAAPSLKQVLGVDTESPILSKTMKRLMTIEEQKIVLSVYENSEDSKLKQAFKITDDMFSEAIKIGTTCRVETDQAKKKSCSDKIDDLYKKSKTPYRLTKYYAIMAGFPSVCTKADFGIGEKIYATPIQTNVSKGNGKRNRVFFCSGSTSTKEKLDIKWRVQAANGKLVRTDEQFSEDINDLINKPNLIEAEKEFGIK